MTALNFVLSEQAVYVVADTLVTYEHEPAYFTTKVFAVPHWNGLICGRGSHGLILDWVMRAFGSTLAVDLAQVDAFAPDIMRDIHCSRPEEEQINCTTSIYHLAFDPVQDRFVGFAYRSTNDFNSEPLEYGIHLKPATQTDVPLGVFPDDFVSLMKQQRKEQDELPNETRCFIGGQVLSWMLERVEQSDGPARVRTTILPAFEWDDFGDSYVRCLDGLAAP
ncbi:hypothetical protein ACFFJC_09355 [Novosphingobium soli]|uniref:Uncharacterized protein n=2 Tax=Novosphingobium soli TaxID=574956 RepID=A0ABV6CUV3_9SPHN